MSYVPSVERCSMRTAALALLGLAIFAGLSAISFAAVVRRDLPRQLELIRADEADQTDDGGIVVYGTITGSSTAEVPAPGEEPLPFTVLSVDVEQAITPNDVAAQVTVYVPGVQDRRLSITPAESEMRVGERVVLFLRVDQNVRDVDADAYKLDSFAEVFRTQKNRGGDVIVLGEGPGCAVENNCRLVDLSQQVRTAREHLARDRQQDGK